MDTYERNEIRETEKQTNWLPYLLIPLAFILGWAGHDALTVDAEEMAQQNQVQMGVGAGPGTIISPTITDTEMMDGSESNSSGL